MNKNDNPPTPKADETVVDLPETSVVDAADSSSEPSAVSPNEIDVVKDRLLRLQADFDNFRKRTARERQEWQAFATEQLIKDFLAVVDHFELGLATAQKNKTPSAVLDGFKLVYEQMLGLLKKQGVTALTAEPGALFDPHQHEAISHLPSEEHPADIIIAETRRGYKLGEKLIRPLQVVVSSGSAGGNGN